MMKRTKMWNTPTAPGCQESNQALLPTSDDCGGVVSLVAFWILPLLALKSNRSQLTGSGRTFMQLMMLRPRKMCLKDRFGPIVSKYHAETPTWQTSFPLCFITSRLADVCGLSCWVLCERQGCRYCGGWQSMWMEPPSAYRRPAPSRCWIGP